MINKICVNSKMFSLLILSPLAVWLVCVDDAKLQWQQAQVL